MTLPPNHKINIKPNWTFVDEQGNELSPKLFHLLDEIKLNSKLTVAAAKVGISYRAAWNLINKATDLFGLPLVELHRGRGAKLSALGEKLLWSKHRVSARLGPQLDNLTSELNMSIQQILADAKPSLRIHASHGYAVALLPDFVDRFQLDLQYKSIQESLAALLRGDCELAGFDVPIEHVSEQMKEMFRTYLNPKEHKVVSFVTRQQGLILQSGNPKNVHGLADLARVDIKFINRQKDSGTRSLLDELIKIEQIEANQIQGFTDEEYTHSAVAAFIAAGMADVGLGIEAAAKHFGLDFLPIAAEHYLMVCKTNTLEQPAVKKLLAVMQSENFINQVKTLPGYTPNQCGKTLNVVDLLNWIESY